MTNNNTKQGFTLIEFLVVVLIIGILATVAVPQYQKAVKKSQFIRLRTMASTLAQTVPTYYISQGTWPTSFDQLDIELPEDMLTATNKRCRINKDMYCCMAAPAVKSTYGSISCSLNNPLIFAVTMQYASDTGKPYQKMIVRCEEDKTTNWCKSLPGARIANITDAYHGLPDGTSKLVNSYFID